MSSSKDEIQPFVLPVTGFLVNGWTPASFPTQKDIEIYVDGVKKAATQVHVDLRTYNEFPVYTARFFGMDGAEAPKPAERSDYQDRSWLVGACECGWDAWATGSGSPRADYLYFCSNLVCPHSKGEDRLDQDNAPAWIRTNLSL